MNTLRQLVEDRYSVRSYESKPVPADDLDYILQCAQLAPSACNRQPWRFVVCSQPASLSLIQQCYPREWFATAPAVIVCCIDHTQEWIRPADQHRHGIVDISIAAEHICLAAAERGLGTCWVCNFDASLCHQLLALPDDMEPAILLPVGYPSSSPAPKVRKPLSDIVEWR